MFKNKHLFRTYLFATTAIALASPQAAFANNQATDQPAGSEEQENLSIQEQLEYLRSWAAEQTLRLDEAEQELARQRAIIFGQAEIIADLRGDVAARSVGARGGVLHVVKSGDTLSAIAAEYGSTVNEIVSANSLTSRNLIRVGQRLTVPVQQPTPAPAPAPAPEPNLTQQPTVMAQANTGQQAAQGQRQAQAQGTRAQQQQAAQRQTTQQQQAPQRTAQQQTSGQRSSGDLPQEVGVRPEDEDRAPEVAALIDRGGILTPKGSLFLDAGIDFSSTSDNRFFVEGISFFEAVLIGRIEASDIDRTSITESVGVRYGITDRLEVDARIPFVHRDDRLSGVSIAQTDMGGVGNNMAATENSVRELSGSGIGDAEFGVHYQLTDGGRFPFLIANVRTKAPTGDGPFQVDRDENGVENELATGSGFWSIEPSVSFILPSAPAVIFGNVGYQINLPTTPDAPFGEGSFVREFDPGDALRFNIGAGLALNERLSVNLGWDQSRIFKTRSVIQTELEPTQLVDIDGELIFDAMGQPVFAERGEIVFNENIQPSANVGSFLFGGSYAVNDKVRLNLNTAFGATDEAPDMRASLRLQYKLW